MAPVPQHPPATSFTCNPWWSGDDKSVLVHLEGHDATDRIAYVIRTQKTFWEIDQLEYIAMVGPSGGIYLDVGSNIGNHAVFFGRFCADHVVAIEPNPRLHPVLRRNIDANALGDRTTIVPFGISDTYLVGRMALREEHDGNIGASHVIPGPGAAAGERVALRRLDDLIAELAPSWPSLPVTFLKIDVEGMEMSVLRSATTLLRVHRPQIFIELITDDALEQATSLLRDWDYTPVARLGSPPSYHFIVPGRHALRDHKWHGGSHHSHSVHMVEEQLAAVTPRDAVVIVADLEEGGFGKAIAGRTRLPFVEKQGEYFGPPVDDAHAIGELMRLRAAGATHFALLWPAFWFFETYPLFEEHLRRLHRCVLENTRAIVFELS